MRYLLDTHSISNLNLRKSGARDDVFVLQDIVDEYAFLSEEVLKIKNAGIKILDLDKKHIQMLLRVMADHGDNFDLIRLYTSEGKGDVAMIAFALAEKEKPDNLFSEEYILITRDNELTNIAESYELTCLKDLPDY